MFIKNKKEMKTKWEDLGIKEKLAITSACIAFAAGWTLTGIAAFVPLLLSEQSVLWILGQSLIYSASVFGIAAYFKSETIQLREDVDRHLEHIERMRYKARKEELEEEVNENDEE